SCHFSFSGCPIYYKHSQPLFCHSISLRGTKVLEHTFLPFQHPQYEFWQLLLAALIVLRSQMRSSYFPIHNSDTPKEQRTKKHSINANDSSYHYKSSSGSSCAYKSLSFPCFPFANMAPSDHTAYSVFILYSDCDIPSMSPRTTRPSSPASK